MINFVYTLFFIIACFLSALCSYLWVKLQILKSKYKNAQDDASRELLADICADKALVRIERVSTDNLFIRR